MSGAMGAPRYIDRARISAASDVAWPSRGALARFDPVRDVRGRRWPLRLARMQGHATDFCKHHLF